MEGSDPGEKLKSTYWNALSANWTVWPFVQAVNFKFVPLQHQVLVVNVVSLGELSHFLGRKAGRLRGVIEEDDWGLVERIPNGLADDRV